MLTIKWSEQRFDIYLDLCACDSRSTSLPTFSTDWVKHNSRENHILKDKFATTETLWLFLTCVRTWLAFLLPMPCYHPQSSCWLFSPSPEAQWHQKNTQWMITEGKHELSYYNKPKASTLMKLSVSFRQVWHGAVWTITTESSERSNRAGSDDQDHHMIL